MKKTELADAKHTDNLYLRSAVLRAVLFPSPVLLHETRPNVQTSWLNMWLEPGRASSLHLAAAVLLFSCGITASGYAWLNCFIVAAHVSYAADKD